jgi:YidC/Oxa1 family membrane protein insertase
MMLISFAVIFGWQIFVAQLYKHHPEWRRPGEVASTQPAATSPPSTAPTTVRAGTQLPSTQATVNASGSTQPAAQMSQYTGPTVHPATNPTAVTIGNDDASRMVVKISPTGAGVESITLKDFKAPGGKSVYTFQEPYNSDDPSTAALVTRSITIDGHVIALADKPWALESHDANSAVYSIDVGSVHVRKFFQVQAREPKNAASGYELFVHHEFTNTGKTPVKVKVAFAGTTTPPRETEHGADLQIISAYDTGYHNLAIDHHAIEEYSDKKQQRDLTTNDDKKPLVWAGTLSVYFDALVRPIPIEKGSFVPKYIEKVTSESLNPDATSVDHQVELTFHTSEFTIQPGQKQLVPTSVFLGPRWRKVLNQPPYSQFPLDYDDTLVLTGGFCGFCTFQWLVGILVAMLNFFWWVFGGFAGHGDWGLAIIALVIVVRVILHPIMKKSQISMVRMGKMGPEMERLKKKYADNKDELNKQMMALYKDQGIGAYLGCLPMFLQMPIWIALWAALRSTFEMRQAPFLWGLTWIHDLSRPDMAFSWHPIAFTLPFFGVVHFGSLNLLPVLMAIVYFLQQKYTPRPPAATPEQEKQQKMMQWMSLLFPVFLYNEPSGLNLYIVTSTGIGIIESKRIRAHLKQQEEAEKAGKVIIDAPRSMKKKRDDEGPGGAKKKPAGPKPAPKTGFAGWVEQLKQKAADLQSEAQRTRGK